MTTRNCKECGATKPIDAFPPRRRWRSQTCQVCFDARRRSQRVGHRLRDLESHTGLRKCRYCTLIRPLEEFPVSHRQEQYRRRECVDCCDIRVKSWLGANHAKRLGDVRSYYKRLRDVVMTGYGNRCQCCGESTSEFLVLDHVNRDGNQYRKTGEHALGSAMFKWVIAHNFPPEIRILCANCNTGREKNGGICPHETSSSTIPKGSTAEVSTPAAGSALHPWPCFAGADDEIVSSLQMMQSSHLGVAATA